MDKRRICQTIWLGLALQLPLNGAALAQGFRINGSGGLDGPTVFNRSDSYSFNGLPGFTNPPTPNPFGTNWLTTLQDSDGPLVVPPTPDRALTATIQKAGDPVMNFHFPDLPFPLTNLPLGQTFVTGQAQEVNTAGGGFDIGRTSVGFRQNSRRLQRPALFYCAAHDEAITLEGNADSLKEAAATSGRVVRFGGDGNWCAGGSGVHHDIGEASC